MKPGDIIKNKSDSRIGLIIDFKKWHWPDSATRQHKSGRTKSVNKVVVLSEGIVREWILDHTEEIV